MEEALFAFEITRIVYAYILLNVWDYTISLTISNNFDKKYIKQHLFT